MGSVAKAAVAALLIGLSSVASAATVWFSAGDSLYRIDPGTNQVALTSIPGPVQALAVNPQDGTAWALAGSRLIRFNEAGVTLTDFDLKSIGIQFPVGLTLNPYDASLWMADGKTLLKLGPEGQVLGTCRPPACCAPWHWASTRTSGRSATSSSGASRRKVE